MWCTYCNFPMCVCICECSCWWRPDYFSSLLWGQVIDSDVIDLHKLVARDEPSICRTAWTHKMTLCSHASGCSVGFYSCCHCGRSQTAACILPLLSSHTCIIFQPTPHREIANPITVQYILTSLLYTSLSILPPTWISLFNINVTFSLLSFIRVQH